MHTGGGGSDRIIGKGDAPPSPRVSVLMTVYNGMPFLAPAVDSILQQTFSDFEFIIVDDGSTDDTAEFLTTLDDPRIEVVHQEQGGTAAAANHGLAFCRGEFTARMDADDISLPRRFERQVQYLDEHPEIGGVGSFTVQLGERRAGSVVALPTGHDEIVDALQAGRHAMSHPSLMIRTSELAAIDGYWAYRLVDDWDMMLRLSEHTRLANLPEPLLRYRVHRGSLNGRSMDRMRFSIDFARTRSQARRAGLPEPDLENFTAARNARPLSARLGSWTTSFSLSNYRLAMAELYGPQPWRCVHHLALAAASRPDLVVRRLGRQLAR